MCLVHALAGDHGVPPLLGWLLALKWDTVHSLSIALVEDMPRSGSHVGDMVCKACSLYSSATEFQESMLSDGHFKISTKTQDGL